MTQINSPLIDSFRDDSTQAKWSVINESAPRRMTMELLDALHQEQLDAIEDIKADQLKYHIFTSDIPGIFNLGGDLGSFVEAARQGDRYTLLDYGHKSLNIINNFHSAYKKVVDSNVTTICVIKGITMGGGVEAALSGNVVIAEEQVTFEFPETRFGLFPGMGAYHLLRQRVPERVAVEVITSGKKYTAGEFLAMGIIDQVCETGTGDSAAADYIRLHRHQHAGVSAFNRAIRNHCDCGLDMSQMLEVLREWVDLVLALPEKQLGIMDKLTKQSVNVA
jgi:DSF synthase